MVESILAVGSQGDFSQRIAEWQTFYAAFAGVAATLAGLLFVSLSLNMDRLLDRRHAATRELAFHAFTNFLYLVLFALIFLIPRQKPLGVGIPLFVLGGMALAQTLSARRRAIAAGARGATHLRLFRLSLIVYSTILVASLLALRGAVLVLHLLVGLMIWLLAWAGRLAWDLLLAFREETADPDGSNDAAGAP